MKKEVKMNKLITIIFVVAGISAHAQYTTGVTIDVKREVANSQKISTLPKVAENEVEIPTNVYPVLTRRAEVDIKVDDIKAAKLRIVEPLSKLYRGYVKAGFGMFNSPLLDVHFMEKRSRRGMWGVNARHFSSRDMNDGFHFSGFSDNNFALYGAKYTKTHALSGDLDISYNTLHQYGTVNDTTISRDQIRQNYQNYGFNGRVLSTVHDSLYLNHDIKFGYYYYQDFKDQKAMEKHAYANENNFYINGKLGKYMNKEYVEGELNFDFNKYKSDSINPCVACDIPQRMFNQGNAILSFSGRIISVRDKLKLKLGLKFDVDMPDVLSSNPKLYFFPDVEIKYSMFNDIFIPYIGATRELQRNSFKTLSQENPFVLSSMQLLNTNNVYKIYAGIKGTLSSKIDFNAEVDHGLYRNLPLFWRDDLYSFKNQFDVIYDTLSITRIKGELSYNKGEDLKIYAKGEYFLYGEGSEVEAWYRPDAKFTIGGRYDMQDKIIAKLDAYILAGRKAGTTDSVQNVTAVDGVSVIDLGTFVDVNMGVEYRYTKRLSVFLNFNNILSRNYRLYQDYPLQGINILGGLTYSF